VAFDPPSAGYLDALFEALRAFTDEIAAGKRWLARAEQTESPAWRLTFLAEARAAFARAPARLASVTAQLAALGPAESLPPPLDRIRDNLGKMRAELTAHDERLRQVEETTRPLGKA
jgi:hypothetical protein